MSEEFNGMPKCGVQDWLETKDKVEEMHTTLTEYLPKLSRDFERVANSNEDIRDRLISPATSAGRVEVKVIMPIIYVLCGVIFCMIVWFTGIEPELPHHVIAHMEQVK